MESTVEIDTVSLEEEASDSSLRLLNLLAIDPAAQSLPEVSAKFEKVYRGLPKFGKAITQEYYALLKKYNLDPGEVRLYIVGGRVKGKPLKEDSDIDLIFEVKNYDNSIEKIQFGLFTNPLDAKDFQIDRMRDVRTRVSETAQQVDIPNLFHVLQFGESFSPRNGDNPQPTKLLIGAYEPKTFTKSTPVNP